MLLYWADRLDGVVCAARGDIVAALDLALDLARTRSSALDLPEPKRIDEAHLDAPPQPSPAHTCATRMKHEVIFTFRRQ